MKYSELLRRYPPSPACGCEICLGFCKRPGWWTVSEAEKSIRAGYARRMMLEVSPEHDFGVLSPAFRGCEGGLALNIHAQNGCNFLTDGLCELHETGYMPLECRFCHHERAGQGQKCHLDIEKDWNTQKGKLLVRRWGNQIGLWQSLRESI
jgi:hypothetical protein